MPSSVNSNKGLMVLVEDLMHVEKLNSCLQARGKEISIERKEVGVNCGADKVSLIGRQKLRIATNLNYGLSNMVSERQKEGVIILNPKRHHMIEIQENENVNVLELETSGVLVNHKKPKNMDVAGLGFQACQDQ